MRLKTQHQKKETNGTTSYLTMLTHQSTQESKESLRYYYAEDILYFNF